MGCDGGTIPTRDELVKTKKNPEQKDNDSVRIFKWQYCHLTQEKLVRPIISCGLGRLYNKEAIIKKLLKRKNIDCDQEEHVSENCSVDHIKSLKDVKELKLTDNPAFDQNKSGATLGDGGYVDQHMSAFICPITGLEMNGSYSFLFDWSTGNVMSKRGYEMVKNDSTVSICDENIVFLNPEQNSEMLNLMVTEMKARRTKAKLVKQCAIEKLKTNKSEKESCTSKRIKLTN